MSSKVPMFIQGHSEGKLLGLAEKEIRTKTEGSVVMDTEAEERIPKFAMKELSLGRVLGRGGFCVVYEINRITLKKRKENSKKESSRRDVVDSGGTEVMEDEHQIHDIVQDRAFMERHCIRGRRDARYAIKVLHDSTKKDASLFVNGVVDLAVEARFLSVIRHPNIIKMRAMYDCKSYCNSNFFIVLDRLYDTLTVRLIKWKKRQLSRCAKMILDPRGSRAMKNWIERCTVAYDLSSALKFLHELNILYRDIKPDNIGFDVRGDVKIFDFGLAKEFDPEKADEHGTYMFTGDTGSPRYMPPEVALSKPYNETADVYSFCILVWEMLELQTPFDGYTMKMFHKKVIHGGARPKFLDPLWLPAVDLTNAISAGWGPVQSRPPMQDLYAALREEINRVSDQSMHENFDASHKSELSVQRQAAAATASSSNRRRR